MRLQLKVGEISHDYFVTKPQGTEKYRICRTSMGLKYRDKIAYIASGIFLLIREADVILVPHDYQVCVELERDDMIKFLEEMK